MASSTERIQPNPPSGFQSVLALLSKLDPYGLEPGSPGGPSRDEYRPEAEAIARLLEQGSISVPAVDGIWSHWFGQALTDVIGLGSAEQFVADLNALPAHGARADGSL